MTTIHMDIDACERFYTLLVEARTTLQDSLDIVNRKVNNTVGIDWIADSAAQFVTEFNALQERLNLKINQLNDFSSRLASDINEAKKASDHFG